MNNWTLSGKLGKDAETRTLDSGKTVITFSLATDETRKGADGQPTKETLWTRVSYFVQTANVAQYLKKGATVLVEGRPRAGHYTDKNGNVVDTLDMVCNRLEIMAFAKDGAEGQKEARSGTNTPKVEDLPVENDKMPF